MPLLTVRIDRVFDIQRPSDFSRHPETSFSIECDGRSHFGLTLPFHPPLRDGMVVTAHLKRDQDWSTLRGWVDHGSGEIVHDSPSLEFHLIASSAFSLVFWASLAPQWPLASLPLGPLAFFWAREFLLRLRERRLIFQEFAKILEKKVNDEAASKEKAAVEETAPKEIR